ncbi:MAG: DUF4286 family protein [Alphaproteobacteria bacterium]
MPGAALITYMDIPPADEAEFNDWYTNEHVAERVDLEGFRSAYRFQAIDAAPRYFAYYETDGLGARTNPTYKAILAKQSDWSTRVMTRFQNFGRMCGPLIARAGRGHGAMALVVRIEGGADGDGLDGFLAETLEAAVGAPLAVGGYLWCADADATGDAAVAGRRILVVEALDETTLRRIAAERFRPADLAAAGAKGEAAVGFYRLISFMEK